MHMQGARIVTSQPKKIPTFGEALRQTRTDRGYSHRDLSDRVGVRQEIVRQWEAGETIPNAQQLKRLYGTLPRLQFYDSLLPHEPPPKGEDKRAAFAEPLVSSPDASVKPKTFGEALRRARVAEELDQDGLGSLLDVTGQAVSAWELDVANPILAHYDQLAVLFPSLALAPKPHAQDIDKPDGGKGAPRDGNPRPATPASPSTRALRAVVPGPGAVIKSDPVCDAHSPRSSADAPGTAPVSNSTTTAPSGSPRPDRPRDDVDQAGAAYAQALILLRRSELHVADLQMQLARAEEIVRIAAQRLGDADAKLKRAVAEAAATAD
jgi:transcriptional regulator with XRE-family HTH domain